MAMLSTAKQHTSVFTMPLLLAIVALVLITALLAEHPELLALSGLLLAVVAGAKVWSRHSLTQLRSTLRVSRQKMFPDEPFSVSVDVENSKWLPLWLSVKVPLGSALPGRKPVGHASLLAFQRATFKWQLAAARRGVHRIGPVELSAADPLGFFPRQRLAAALEITVYPRLVPLKPSALPRRDFFGQRSARGLVEDPVLITGVRDYQHGRAARFIHWKASARYNRLIEKVCETAEHESVLLVVHAQGFASDATGQAIERCLEVVASLAVELDRQRCAFGFATNGRLPGSTADVLSVARREGQLAQLLETLARLEPVATAELSELVQRAVSYGTSVLCFTYALDDSLSALSQLLLQRRLPLVAVLCGPHADRGHSSIMVRALEALRE